MKQSVNFRLSKQAINTLSVLEEKLHTTKTSIVEEALHLYAKKKLSNKNELLAYAGILDENEASSMLTLIKSTKHNKNVKIRL